jgi:hypothetical protein
MRSVQQSAMQSREPAAQPDPARLLAEARTQRSRARRWVAISAAAVAALAAGAGLAGAQGRLSAPLAVLAGLLIAINLARLVVSAAALVRIRRAMRLVGTAVAAAGRAGTDAARGTEGEDEA